MNYRLEVFGVNESTGYHQRGYDRRCFANADYNVWLKLLEDGVCNRIKLIDTTTGITIKEAVLCPTE